MSRMIKYMKYYNPNKHVGITLWKEKQRYHIKFKFVNDQFDIDQSETILNDFNLKSIKGILKLDGYHRMDV